MEVSVTKALSCREKCSQPESESSGRSTSTAVKDSNRSWSRCRGYPAANTEEVWSTHSSRHVGNGDRSRSRSTEARLRSTCHRCGGNESMETLNARLLSPDSGAIVFSETPETEMSTASTTPNWPNEVGICNYYIIVSHARYCSCGAATLLCVAYLQSSISSHFLPQM